ncbi:MAG: twin-arginine translocase TatA/TatE family subunit [Armatimonadota bacterium]|nr:twin-arginine translocase TatA/TatE family subunit [Armatimonadota bacterium]
MPHVGPTELLIVAGVVVLLFVPKRLPDLVRGIGQSVREFRKGMREEEADQATRKGE